MDTAVIIAIIGILSATTGALIWIIKHLFTSVIPAIDKLSEATEMNTKATQSADEYLRERNGRDTHFHSNISKTLIAIKDEMIAIKDDTKANNKAVALELKRVGDETAKRLEQTTFDAKRQSVAEQVVKHQVINNKA